MQFTLALMCSGEWSHPGYVKDEDIKEVVAQSEVLVNKKKISLLRDRTVYNQSYFYILGLYLN